MDSDRLQTQAVEVLQELGLKEYEAKSFVALSRLPLGTAKDISETTDVPRTRVYDAIRVLEAKGLVEIQHSNPQQFRAVPVEEAVDSLQEQYQTRVRTLRQALETMEPADRSEDAVTQEVWALSGSEAIANRTQKLLEEATDEIVMVVGSDAILTPELLETLAERSAHLTVIVGTFTAETRDRIGEAVPEARVFVSGLDWLHGSGAEDESEIGRHLLVDRETVLVSSVEPVDGRELAVFGRGFGNGLVVIARRLMATGLIPAEDPGQV